MSSSLSSCTSLITSHFQLQEDELSQNYISQEELEKALTKIINTLLNQDMPRLLNACYKIDLDQQVFEKILAHENPDQISNTLAKEVIKRELQKVETRKKYRNQ